NCVRKIAYEPSAYGHKGLAPAASSPSWYPPPCRRFHANTGCRPLRQVRLSPLAATVQGQGALRCVGRGGLTTKRGDGVRVTRELIGISDGSQTLATPFKDRRVR